MFILKKENLQSLLRSWQRNYEVFAPQTEHGQVMLLPYEDNSFTTDFVNFAFPVKEHIFKQREILFNWRNDEGKITVETPRDSNERKAVYFGIRPCEAYGIKYSDKFFLEGYRDEFYGRKRDNTIIAALNCNKAGENCFCSSMGTGPFAEEGYDLLFTPLKDAYLVETGSIKGQELVNSSRNLFDEADESILNEKGTVLEAALNSFNTKINNKNVGFILEENYNNPIWDKLHKECITCTGCTNLCPTCTCFNVVEEKTGECSGCRVRYWDSCQNDSFTRNAGNHNPRSSKARVRYRIYDKFKYIEDKFNMKGCTGCGRCINVCPASINVVEIINSLAESSLYTEEKGDE